MGKDSNTIKIKVETGQEEEKKKESPSGGLNTGQNQQGMPVQNVVPNALGYAQNREAAANRPPLGYSIPNGPSMTLDKTLDYIADKEIARTVNRPELVNLSVSRKAEGLAGKIPQGAETNAQYEARKNAEKTAFERGYEEQQMSDAMRLLVEEANAAQKRADDGQKTLDEAITEDETQQRNERSRKVIAGMGDAISSIVNLVGTMNGAYDQKQVFMEPRLRDAIEQDRQRRYAKMERLRANVQQQINKVQSLKGAIARQQAAEDAQRQAAAMKMAELDWKEREAEKNREFEREKAGATLALQQQKFMADNAIQRERLNEQNRHNRASEGLTGERNRAYISRVNALNSRTGSGNGTGGRSGKWYDMNNFNEFQDEIARSIVVDGKRYSSWDELMSDPAAARKSSSRVMINEIMQANTSDKQRAAVQKYIDHAPSWKSKYWGQEVAEYDEPEEESAPWLSDEEEDKDKAPWL